jgi:hypothetical protein
VTTTWTQYARGAKAVCSTGTESAPSTPAKATGTVAFSTAVAGNTVTIRGRTFTALANGSTPANTQQFAVGTGGSADTDTGTAFAAAVNANSSILGVTAVNASGTVTLTANDYGTASNAISLTRVGAPITVSGATLASGVDYVGANLQDVTAFQVFAHADSGQTLTGGALDAYLFDDVSGLWARAPTLDLALDANAIRSQGFASDAVICGRGRLAYVPDSVTISSGSVTILINCVIRGGVDGGERTV